MIQTVTGEIDKVDLGKVLMHEHISCRSLPFYNAFNSSWLDKSNLKNLVVDTLITLKQKYGLNLMVDATPIDLGRDAILLKEVSLLSGVKIVASTGFYYLNSIETFNNSAEELALWIISECENGISGSEIKPGILKCATGSLGITEDNNKKLSAIGIVQQKTGLPVYVHCEHFEDIAFKQLNILLKNGANLNKIIIGHTAIRPDGEYLESILQKGCYICMDQCHCYPQNLSAIAKALLYLCEKGYKNKILLSNDYCIHSDFCNINSNGLHLNSEKHANGFGYVFDKVYNEFIGLGGKESDWIAMTFNNPVEILDK